MRNTQSTQPARAAGASGKTGRIPAQPGPRGVPLGMLVAPAQPEAKDATADQPGPEDVMVGTVSADAGEQAGHGAVIPGAGPATRPGERATVRLRDVGPDDPPRYAPEWLELREGADAVARAPELLDPLRIRLANLPGRSGVVIHDLGCGTGSMGRWLAPASTAPSTGSCTTATPTSCTSPPSPPPAPPPTAAASRWRPGAATWPG